MSHFSTGSLTCGEDGFDAEYLVLSFSAVRISIAFKGTPYTCPIPTPETVTPVCNQIITIIIIIIIHIIFIEVFRLISTSYAAIN